MNKKDELLNLINDKDYDVIALTEIYPKNIVDSNVSDIEWKIKGYKEFISPSDIATTVGMPRTDSVPPTMQSQIPKSRDVTLFFLDMTLYK